MTGLLVTFAGILGVFSSSSVQDDMILKGHTRAVLCAAVSPDGKWLASGGEDNTVKLWNLENLQNVATLEGHDGAVKCVAFSPDSKTLVSGEMYKKIFVWDLESKKNTNTFTGFDGAVNGISFSPDGKFIFAGSTDNTARKFAIDGKEVVKYQHKYSVYGVVVSGDGKQFGTITDNGGATMWSAASAKTLFEAKFDDYGWATAMSKDNKWFATAHSKGVKVWDAATGKERDGFSPEKIDARAIAFSPDGKKLVVGSFDNEVFVLDAETGATLSKVVKHDGPVGAIAVNPNGKFFYTGSRDMTLRAWPL